MNDKYGFFMAYDSDYHKTMHKLNMFVKSLIAERQMNVKHTSELKRNILLLQIPSYKNTPGLNNKSKVDQFRHKYLILLQLKFNPFVKSVDFMYWR